MKDVILCFYGEYGKYITRLRSIPYFIDGLTPVSRRLLISLYETARDKLTKSNKIIGYAISHLHPHGDLSCYESLQNLVIDEFASSEQGNWGGRSLHGQDKAAAMRYTESKLNKWVRDLAFKYYDYAPRETIEYEEEPIYLPSPVPLGLVGYDMISGIAFHRTTIPKYTIKDLATRLEWLLINGPIKNEYNSENISEEERETTLGPEIKPNFRDCVSKPTQDDSYYRILTDGESSLRLVPNGGIGNDGCIYIQGQVPETSFKKLKTLCDPTNKNRKFNVDLIDLCGNDGDYYSILIQVVPNKKNEDLKKLFKQIWSECLVGNLNFHCYFSDDEGKAIKQGIDDILIRNYNYWKNCVVRKRADNFRKVNQKKFELSVVHIIREILEQSNYTIKKVNDIVNHFQQNYTNNQVTIEDYDIASGKFENVEQVIDSEAIQKVCKEKSITRLIEIELNFQEVENQIQDAKNHILNTDSDCFNHIVNLKT